MLRSWICAVLVMLQSRICVVWVMSQSWIHAVWGMLQFRISAVWVMSQSWICYSLGYVTSLGYIAIWEVSSLGYVQSGICYSLGYVTVWVMSSLGCVSLGYVAVWVMLQSRLQIVWVSVILG